LGAERKPLCDQKGKNRSTEKFSNVQPGTAESSLPSHQPHSRPQQPAGNWLPVSLTQRATFGNAYYGT